MQRFLSSVVSVPQLYVGWDARVRVLADLDKHPPYRLMYDTSVFLRRVHVTLVLVLSCMNIKKKCSARYYMKTQEE